MQKVTTESLSKFLNTIVKKKYPQVDEIIVTSDSPVKDETNYEYTRLNNVYIILKNKTYLDSSDNEIIEFVREASKIILFKSGRAISIVSFATRN
jgi:hypothetical protein